MNGVQLTNHLTAQFMASAPEPVRGQNHRGRRLQRVPVRHEPQTSQTQVREVRET